MKTKAAAPLKSLPATAVGKLRYYLRQKIIANLPDSIRSELYRSMIQFEFESSHQIELRVARTREELEAAASLLHDNYVQAGFMNPHRSGKRFTKYHCLPTTTTLIACIDGQVAGTVSLIRRSAFGTPVDAICDLKPFLQRGERVIEVSSLAVARKFSQQRGKILLPLLNYLFQYSEKCFGGDHLVIAVNPTWWDFYRHVLLFERLAERPIKNYSFVNGAPAVVGILDLKKARERFKSVYGHRKPSQNLFYVLGELQLKGAQFPERSHGSVNDPVLTPELLYDFFAVQTDIFASLSEREKETLWRLYPDPRYRLILPRPVELGKKDAADGRSLDPRLDVNIDVKVEIAELKSRKQFAAQIKNLTLKGALLISERGLRVGERVNVAIRTSNTEFIAKFEVVWSNPDGSNGLRILGFPLEWLRLVKFHQSLAVQPAGQTSDPMLEIDENLAQAMSEPEATPLKIA